VINKNSPRFNRHNVRLRKKELHNIALKRMRQAVIMLLMHRLLRKAVMFCAFKKTQELMTAKKRNQEELLVCKTQKITSA
jgi:hypothetical protein